MMLKRKGMGSATPGVYEALATASVKYGVPLEVLTAIATQESGLNQAARSSAGAIGVMQLMPGTAAQYGADPYDLQQNVDAGAHYFSDMLRRYNGDTSLALAAYNAGPGNVAKYGGIPPFPETQNYVASVMAMIGSMGSDPGVDPGFDPGAIFDGEVDQIPDTVLGVDPKILALLAVAAIGAIAMLGGRS